MVAAQLVLFVLLKSNSAHILAHTYKLLLSDTFSSVAVVCFLCGVTPCALDAGHLHALGEAQGALAAFSACFGIWRPERTPIHHGTVIPTSLSSLLWPPFTAPASLQLISAPQAVVTTHHIMTQSRETEAPAPPPRHPLGP